MRVVSCIIIIAIFIGVSCSKEPQLHFGPRIKFGETEIDFGEIAQKQRITHIFKFENIGGDTLIIEKVRARCGCTAGAVASKRVAPKGKSAIKVTFYSGRYKGNIRKTVSVYSNDSTNAVVRLTVRATVLGPCPWVNQSK